MHGGPAGESPGAVKQQIIGLIHAVAYLRGRLFRLPSIFQLHSIVYTIPVFGVSSQTPQSKTEATPLLQYLL